MKHFKLLLFMFALLLINSSCVKEDDLDMRDSILITDQEGVMRFLPDVDLWAIQVTGEGTFDVVDFYLVKKIDSDLKQDGLRVIFNGNAWKNNVQPGIGGTTYYVFHVTDIRQKK